MKCKPALVALIALLLECACGCSSPTYQSDVRRNELTGEYESGSAGATWSLDRTPPKPGVGSIDPSRSEPQMSDKN